MRSFKNLAIESLVILVLILGVAVAAFFFGRNTKQAELEPTVTSQTIFEMITDQYFVVSKTIYTHEEVRVSIEENSDWSDLLWKDVITAQATIKTDIGVDLSGLKASDISVDEETNVITIAMPEASILSTSIEEDLKIDSEQGLVPAISELFEAEAEDYNLVSLQLKEQANEAISNSLLLEAKNDSLNILEIILGELGYSIIIK